MRREKGKREGIVANGKAKRRETGEGRRDKIEKRRKSRKTKIMLNWRTVKALTAHWAYLIHLRAITLF